jgi:hypothetical protein
LIGGLVGAAGFVRIGCQATKSDETSYFGGAGSWSAISLPNVTKTVLFIVVSPLPGMGVWAS